MLIVGLCASPRPGQSSFSLMSAALEAAGQAVPGAKTQLVELAGKQIHGCLACGACAKELKCSQDDDFPALLPLLADSELAGLMVASPVYFGGMTAQAKAFLDRMVSLRRNGFLMKDKVGGAIAVGGFRNGGQELTIQAIHAAMLVQGMVVVGDDMPTGHFGGTGLSTLEGGIAADAFGLATSRNLGQRVALVAARLARGA
jgi:multimeric flavodoxin WrbA